ncbi:MAG: potassium channel family protein [Planctomycetota bacterium]
MPSRSKPVRFGVLLGALIALLLGIPLGKEQGSIEAAVMKVTVTAVLLTGVVSLSRRRRLALLIAAPAVGLIWLPNLIPGDPSVLVLAHLVAAGYHGYFCVVVLKHIFAQKQVSPNVVSGALCLYLLLGIFWCYVYGLIGLTDHQAFIIQGERGLLMMDASSTRTTVQTVYFSFVTLFTLGYGDIVPHSDVARMCAVVEALLGQVIMVVLIAMLVGKQIAQSSKPD